jgi:prepilin-type N-terminal cleavage/methylation domain-containing protein
MWFSLAVYTSKSMKTKGFTFIELMISISIMAVLGVLATAGFSNYNQIQVLQTSSNDIITMLNEAKSRAQSQVKLGTICSDSLKTLTDYRVDISQPKSYSLNVDCQDSGLNNFSDLLETKNLPQNVNFDSTSSPSFSFPVLSGGVEGSSGSGPWTITVSSSDGKTRTITISALGGINAQ